MSEKFNEIVSMCVCERENGAKMGFWWFGGRNSKLNLKTVKETYKWCVWSGGIKRNSKL